jgi:protein-tyrosine phosphatase
MAAKTTTVRQGVSTAEGRYAGAITRPIAGAGHCTPARIHTVHQVLFVCTGNIFRSMTAEFALRHALRPEHVVGIASAGIEDRWYEVHPYVSGYLRSRGIDVSRHRRRTLGAGMMGPGVSVIAMSTDHREFIAREFGLHDVQLYTEACGLEPAPLLDIHEAVADYATNPEASAAHVRATIDRIIDLTPRLVQRLDGLKKIAWTDE